MVIESVLDARPEAELAWTGRTVRVSGFATHLRSEDALHRWDLVGDDVTSRTLLAQEDLLAHAVSFVGQPLLQRGLGAGAGTEPLVARVRSDGHDDLVVSAAAGEGHLSVEPAEGPAAIEGDAAARLLLLWGRKPTPFTRLRVAGEPGLAGRTQALLSGY